MKITKIDAVQVHPVPNGIRRPRGPFPRELFADPEIVTVEDYVDDEVLGDTAQNNFKPTKYLYCSVCYERVKSTDTETHICPDPADAVEDDDDSYYPEGYPINSDNEDEEWQD